MLKSLLTEVYTRMPDISAPEPNFQVANFINGINSLPATWTPERHADTMKTKAAVLWGLHQKWEVEEVDLDGPKEDEVLVKLTASGLCHSDDHLVTGDMPMQMPVVGGHEGAGVVVGGRARRHRRRRGRLRGAELHSRRAAVASRARAA